MVLYNDLPKKEYERIFMCKTAKDIWKSLLIRHQCNSQVKDNKIDLLVQQYEQFTILEEESIDSGFARFNTIITSLKALDECFSSKNYVRKFLRALRPKWRAKEIVKSIALKAKKESSDDETSTSGSNGEEYAMAVRNFKKFFRRKGKFVRQPREEKKSFRQRDEKKGKSDRKCFRCGDPNHLIGDCLKPSRNKDQKAFIGGGDDMQVVGSLSVLATFLQTKELDESMLDALGILPQRKQHKKLLLKALVGEDSGEEQLFASKNCTSKDGSDGELNVYLQRLKDQYEVSCSYQEVGESPRVYRYLVD
nr:zf-CCHC domain-containing protein/DUF4219 domain-containing protein/UBN2 domain-containing protein [Tanacetum cinerariifolium]